MTTILNRRALMGCALLCIGLVPIPEARAQSLEDQLATAPPIVRVEEDWEIKIGTPDPAADLPQIVTVFGPTNALFGTHAVFEINHCTLPSFRQGGMQIQLWWGEFLVGTSSQHAPTELNTPGETIRFTTVTRIQNHRLLLYVKDGRSDTWEEFGGSGSLYLDVLTARDDLNPYDPENSIRHSRVTFGANRVNQFCRTAIRFYSSEGLFLDHREVEDVHRLAVTAAPSE